MSQLWVPGMAGLLEELVSRIHRRIEDFKETYGLDEVAVSIELFDGSLHRLARLSADPGFGFVTLCPHGDEKDPEELIVPLGAIRQVRIGRTEPAQPLGFTSFAG
jgi:hypothetical protein